MGKRTMGIYFQDRNWQRIKLKKQPSRYINKLMDEELANKEIIKQFQNEIAELKRENKQLNSEKTSTEALNALKLFADVVDENGYVHWTDPRWKSVFPQLRVLGINLKTEH